MFKIYFILICLKFILQTAVTFIFVEYPYKVSEQNEEKFREFETACEQSSRCSELEDLDRTKCVRECVSPVCYKELYKYNPLEEGEIDVRLDSFKGCFVRKSDQMINRIARFYLMYR